MRHYLIPLFNRATYARIRGVLNEARKHDFKITVALSSSILHDSYGQSHKYIKGHHKEYIDFVELPTPETPRTVKAMTHDIGLIIDQLTQLFMEQRYDGVVVVADRYETIAAAIASVAFNIPLIHIQGGEVTLNVDERIRHAVTKFADYHFVSTKQARKYVIAMGEESRRVFHTGCPSLDFSHKMTRKKSSEAYCILQYHPVTDHVESGKRDMETIMATVAEYCKKKLMRCYVFPPNPDPGREDIALVVKQYCEDNPDIFTPVINEPHDDFIERLRAAKFIIGNSSGIIREASYASVPGINIGDRQGLRERSWNVIDVDVDAAEITSAMKRQYKVRRYEKSYLYGWGNAGKYVCDLLTKIPLTRKTGLTYPTLEQFRETHFGEARYGSHRASKGFSKKRLLYPRSERRRVQGESGASKQGSNRETKRTPAHSS